MLKNCFLYFILMTVCIVANTKENEKMYNIPSGIVIYTIHGGGTLAEETNLSIEGKEKLTFKEWGNERIVEMDRIEIVTGVLHSVEKQYSLNKSDDKAFYSVDFDNQSIIMSNLLDAQKGKIDLSGMQQEGTMTITSLECNVWRGDNQRICLHNGVVLLDEKSYLGFNYTKKAQKVDLNITLDEKVFDLPEYPVKKDQLMRLETKTTQDHKIKTVSDKIIASKENFIPTDKAYSEALSDFTNALYEKEKENLPLLLETMLQARACLFDTQTIEEANQCLFELVAMKSLFNQNQDNLITDWSESSKQKLFNGFDIGIRELKGKMPCVNRALNIADLSACMK